MAQVRAPMEPTLFRFIWRYSKRQQAIVTILTLASFPVLYYTLQLPKLIINQAISGKRIPASIVGFHFNQLQYLFLLSFIFLGLVLVNGGFKYLINTYKGRLGERMLRRLRFELYARVLRFPPAYFTRTAPGQFVPMILSEIETLGGFIGDSVSLPVLQGGTLLTILIFMALQDPMLGLAAIALYPAQMYVIPRLQRKVNRLTRRRIQHMRTISDRITETAVGLQEIQSHGTLDYQAADFSAKLAANYRLRYDIFKWKFFVKFLNNFIGQLTPFFFYLIGGYLVINGDISFGSLVAVLSAYKDLNAPWTELLTYYQDLQDQRIRYAQVVEQFDVPGMLPVERLTAALPPPADGPVELSAVAATLVDDSGRQSLDGASFALAGTDKVALIGPEAGGKHELAMVLGGVAEPTRGRVCLDGQDVAGLPHPLVARRLGYVGPATVLFAGSFFDNLVFGLQVRPNPAEPADAAAQARRRAERFEAELTGNSPHDIEDDWIDYQAAGAATREQFRERIAEVLTTVGLFDELRELGLRGRIVPENHPDLVETILVARKVLVEHLVTPETEGFYEPFAADRFTDMASIGENLLFGMPTGHAFDRNDLGRHPYVRQVLAAEALDSRLIEIGADAARTLSEIFKGLDAGHELVRRYSFVDVDELTALQPAINQLQRQGIAGLKPDDQAKLLSLSLRMIPARHRLGLIEDDLREAVVRARPRFRAELPPALAGELEFFDIESYTRTATLRDNLLFGRLVAGQDQVSSRMRTMIREVLERHGLYTPLTDVLLQTGLEMNVGVGGSQLTAGVRQKLAIGRALLKRPDVLILNDPAQAIDPQEQIRLVDAVLAFMAERPVAWVLQKSSLARHFQSVAVVDGGRVVEQGSWPDLDRDGTQLRAQLAAE